MIEKANDLMKNFASGGWRWGRENDFLSTFSMLRRQFPSPINVYVYLLGST